MLNIIVEILPMIVSLFIGIFAEHSKQKAADDARRNELLILQVRASDKSHREARKYNTPNTSWSRKFIVQSVIGSLFLFPMCLTVMNYFAPALGVDLISISVPKELIEGRGVLDFIFGGGGHVITEYVPIYGFVLMPIHILITQSLVGFYFGSSAMRR